MRFDFNRSPPSVIDFLQRDDASAALLPRVERLLRLQDDLFAAMPGALRAGCEVASDDATVVLRVASASIAAKLRQTLPRLRQALVESGWRIDEIRIRVSPRSHGDEPVASSSSRRAAIPASGMAAFEALGRSLEDSPLRAAVDRLVSRRAPRA